MTCELCNHVYPKSGYLCGNVASCNIGCVEKCWVHGTLVNGRCSDTPRSANIQDFSTNLAQEDMNMNNINDILTKLNKLKVKLEILQSEKMKELAEIGKLFASS